MHDDATEPLQVQSSTPEPTPIKSWFRRPVMMGASAGLGALLAANIVLVWAVSIGPQSARIEAKSANVTAAPAAAPPAAPAPSVVEPAASAGIDSLDPFGATPAGASASSGGTSDLFSAGASGLASPTMGAFTPTAPSIPGGSVFPTLPGLDQESLDAVTPLMPGLLPAAVSGDAVISALTAGGGWLTSAAVSAGNNATLLLGDLILYYAYTNGSGVIGPGQNGLANLMALPQIASSLQAAAASLPSLGLPSLPAPDLAGLPAALAALAAGSSVPSLGLPTLPAPDLAGLPAVLAALTATGLPALPQIPIPQLPPLPQIPVPQLPQIPLPQFPAPHLWPFF
jgi:hypothetical protein